MSDPYIGEIKAVAFDFAPIDWASCRGQQINISQNQALYSLLGIYYGGDGRTSFNLPNLSGGVPVGRGISTQSDIIYKPGDKGGTEVVRLGLNNILMHTHSASISGTVTGAINVSSESAVIQDASDAMIALGKAGTSTVTGYKKDGIDSTKIKTLAPSSVSIQTSNVNVEFQPNGNPQGIINMQPYAVINYIIAVRGYYPPRP